MKTKFLNLLAVLALFFTLAASSLAIHQSAAADGAYRIGWVDADGSDDRYMLIGAVVGEDTVMDATAAAKIECDGQLSDESPATVRTSSSPQCNQDPSTSTARSFPSQSFENKCIAALVVDGTRHNDGGWFSMGVGIADNCQAAAAAARTNCTGATGGDCQDTGVATSPAELNSAGALYLRDGTATACPINYYDASGGPETELDCQRAMNNTQCRINDDANDNVAFPFHRDSDDTCHATIQCTTNERPNGDGSDCDRCIDINRLGINMPGVCGDCQPGNKPPDASNPNDGACVFDPDSCTVEQYAADTDTACMSSCGDLNRENKAGANCGACMPNFTSDSDATTSGTSQCTFDPTSCTAEQYAAATDTACMSSCGDLNRKDEAGQNCGVCLMHFTHASEATTSGTSQCTFNADSCAAANMIVNSTENDCESCDTGMIPNPDNEGNMNDTCIMPEMMDAMDMSTADFTFELQQNPDGISGDGTTATPFVVDITAVANFTVAIATTLAGEFMYAKNGGSEELTVTDAGLVSFITASVAANDYNIVVEASSDNITATISLFAEVSPAESEMEEAPVFVFQPVDNDGAPVPKSGDGQQATPYEYAADEVANVSIILAPPDGDSGDYIYTKEDRSSEELAVGMTDGVVEFIPDTVDAGNYQIFVAAAINGSNIATTSLYLTVAAAAMSVTNPGNDGDMDEDTTTNNIVSRRSTNSKLAAGLGAGIAFFMVYYTVSDYVGHLDWTPSYAFHNNNGNMQYSVGSRWTATADNWRFYWQTRQNGGNGNGQFVYSSGASYHGNIWSATMNSKTDAETTDMVLSLSANKTAGLWNFGGSYKFDAAISDTEATDTQNRLNIAARYTLNKWVLSANANTNGDTAATNIAARYVVDRWILSANANTNGNTTAARINYSYRF